MKYERAAIVASLSQVSKLIHGISSLYDKFYAKLMKT